MDFTDDVYALVVDDDEDAAETVASTIDHGTEHVSTEYVTSAEEALDYLESEPAHVVVSDYEMPGMNGLELLGEVQDVPFMLYTGEGSEDLAVQASKHGAEDYVRKGDPQAFDVLSRRAENAAIKNKAEEELTVFKGGAENAGHAIQVTDPQGNIVYVNPAFEDQTGYDEEELLGENPSITISEDYDENFHEDMWAKLKNGEVWRGEVLNEDKEGDRYWVDRTVSPITNNGNIEYVIGITRDITDKKEENQRREVINSILRHDLGNNQQVIKGYLDLLQRTDLTDLQEEYVNKILTSVEDNRDLFDGIRDILENDPQEDVNEEVEIEDVVDDALEEKRDKAESQDVQIESHLEEQYKVSAGPLLDRAISNLVENAVVHPDTVETVEVGAEEVGDNQVELYVADDGEGLPDDFSWEKGVKGKESDGTGVGTWLVKEIAETYGEGVEAGESEEGGAKFSMKLDLAK